MRMHLYPHRAKVARPARVAAGSTFADASEEESVDRIAVAEAALAGWLQAAGFVGQYETGTNRSLTIEFQVANDDELTWVLDNLDVALPDVRRKIRDVQREDGSVSCRRVRLYGKALRSFVEAPSIPNGDGC